MNRRILRAALWSVCLLSAAPSAHAQVNGTISGTVIDAQSGQPVTTGFVHAQSFHDLLLPFGTAVTDGTFTLSLPPDTYFLWYSSGAGSYASATYGGCSSPACSVRDGMPLPLASGQTISGLTFPVTLGATISGELIYGGTPPVTPQDVVLVTAAGVRVGQVSTSNRQFSFTRVAPGDYYLIAPTQTWSLYPTMISDGRACANDCRLAGGVPFHVVAGASVTQNIAIPLGGRITGRVTDDSGRGRAVTVVAWTLAGTRIYQSGSEFSGNYSLGGLPTGDYIVSFSDSLDLVEHYDNIKAVCAAFPQPASCAGLRRLGRLVHVDIGQTVSGIDAVLETGGVVTGTVTVQSGDQHPTAFATVRLFTAGGHPVAQSDVGGSTYFLRSIPAGRYYVCAVGSTIVTRAYGGPEFSSDSCPPSTGTPIDVVPGQTTSNINFVVRPRAEYDEPGTIGGRVTASDGSPLSGSVALYQDGKRVASAFADASGQYQFTRVYVGTYYLRTEMTANVVDAWYGGVCALCSAGVGTAVTMPRGGTITNIDFVLAAGSSISGQVIGGGDFVGVFDVNDRELKTFRPVVASNPYTYTLQGLPAGTYVVKTYALIANNPYSNVLLDVTYPTPIAVGAGSAVTGIDLTVAPGGVIRGRVSTADARVIDGFTSAPFRVRIQAYDENGQPVGRYTDMGGGVYEIRGLPSGRYTVGTLNAHAFGYPNQLYPGLTCVTCPVSVGTTVHVTPGRVTDHIDFSLRPGGAISGRALDAELSTPIDNVIVEILTAAGRVIGTDVTTIDGSYRVSGLPPGSFFVVAKSAGLYLGRRYLSPTCAPCIPGVGDRVVVAETNETAGIDIRMHRGARVTGRVTGPGNQPLSGVQIVVNESAGVEMARTVTDATGSYAATFSPTTVFVRAIPTANYVGQIYNGIDCVGTACSTPGSGTPLTPTLLASLNAIDFGLRQCRAGSLGPAGLASVTVSNAYRVVLTPAGGVGPYRFELIDGTLPVGTTLNASTGVIDGVLTMSGDFVFTVAATDGTGCVTRNRFVQSVSRCPVTLSTEMVLFPSTGGVHTIEVSSPCAWGWTRSGGWFTARGTGSGVMVFADANTGQTREGTIVIGERVVVVRQAGVGTSAPFGQLDAPANNAQVHGSIAVGGWALDDVAVTRVRVFRDPVTPEPQGAPVYLGDAVRVRGARPDVELAFPSYPGRDRAGWGFLLLTNMLPNRGNGTFRLHAFAEDAEGHQTLLGSRTIAADNQSSLQPFGAIDTPAQGETISGSSYVNFGWALTPLPKTIPIDGSRIWVSIDGVVVGTVTYNNLREDVAGLFPGLNNTNGAIGYRIIDTTRLADGLHTISWIVMDDAGAAEGIGSRYFTVDNGIGMTATAAPIVAATTAESVGRIRVAELEPIDLMVMDGPAPCGEYEAHEHVAGTRRPLPVGSTFDPLSGRFSWQPGPGFIGSYHLVFTRPACDGGGEVGLTVTIVRRSSR